MHIMCDVRFKASNAMDAITIVAAYLEKTTPDYHLHENIRVPLLVVKEAHISVSVFPVRVNEGDMLDGRLCFKDIEGNVYKTDVLRFRSVE